MLRIVSKAGSSIPTKFSLGLQMATPCSRFVKFMKIPGYKYYFVTTGTQPGQRPKNRDCPGEIRTLGNYDIGIFLVAYFEVKGQSSPVITDSPSQNEVEGFSRVHTIGRIQGISVE